MLLERLPWTNRITNRSTQFAYLAQPDNRECSTSGSQSRAAAEVGTPRYDAGGGV
jgi:hypothetical protein